MRVGGNLDMVSDAFSRARPGFLVQMVFKKLFFDINAPLGIHLVVGGRGDT